MAWSESLLFAAADMGLGGGLEGCPEEDGSP